MVAWRHRHGTREILLVTSRRTGRWVVPKGMVEAHLGVARSAQVEAWEEGGVRGELSERPVGSYRYEKWGRSCRVVLFAMRVTEVADDWPEASERDRAWVPLDAAAARVGQPNLARCLDALRLPVEPRFPVSWVPDEVLVGPGRLGVCSIPGDSDAGVAADLRDLAEVGVTHLVCLVEASELAWLQPPERPGDRAASVAAAGMAYLHAPIEDFSVPDPEQLARILRFVEEGRASDGSVVLHCWAGLGRSGTLLACALVRQGMSARDAVVTTRWIRPGAIQSEVQEALIDRYAKEHRR